MVRGNGFSLGAIVVVGLLLGLGLGVHAQAQPPVSATKSWDLSVDVDGGGVPSPGDTLRYTVRIENTGTEPLVGLVFTDTPSDPLALVVGSVQTTKGSIDSGNNPGDVRVVVNIPRLEPGEVVAITFEMRVCVCATDVREVRNQGTVITPVGEIPTDNPDTPDVPGDETVTPIEPQEVPQPGPITKQATLLIDADGSGTPSPGDTLRYTIRIPNVGTLPLTGVVVKDPMGEGLRLIPGSVTATSGTVVSGNSPGDKQVVVSIPEIPPGETATIVLDAEILPGVLFVKNQGIVDVPGGPIPTDNPETPNAVGDETVTPIDLPPRPEAVPTGRPKAACVATVIDEGARLVRFEDVSFDPEGDIVARVWDFDDGTGCPPDCSAQDAQGRPLPGSEKAPVHRYTLPTRVLFVVRLTVTDSAGNTDTATCRVLVGDPPILKVLDENGNGLIDTAEFFKAVDYWVSGDPVPFTDDQEQRVIDDALFFTILDLWLSEAPIESVLGAQRSPHSLGAIRLELRRLTAGTFLEVQAPGAAALSVELYDLSGRTVARAQGIGPQLRLALRGTGGRAPANGVYLYRVVARDLRGQLIQRTGKLVTLR